MRRRARAREVDEFEARRAAHRPEEEEEKKGNVTMVRQNGRKGAACSVRSFFCLGRRLYVGMIDPILIENLKGLANRGR